MGIISFLFGADDEKKDEKKTRQPTRHHHHHQQQRPQRNHHGYKPIDTRIINNGNTTRNMTHQNRVNNQPQTTQQQQQQQQLQQPTMNNNQPIRNQEPPPKEPFYYIKYINYGKRSVPIILQHKNGPCPLIAIANVLSLTNKINFGLHPNSKYLTHKDLINVIAGKILERPTNNETEEMYVKEALDMLPHIEKGLDVNIKFNGTFEFTEQLSIFDILNIRVVHGWVVDPDHTETFSVLHSLSYNQAVNLLCQKSDVISSSTTTTPMKPIIQEDDDDSPVTTPLGNTPSTPVSKATKLNDEQVALLCQKAYIIEDYLNQYATQLTPYGLNYIADRLTNQEVGILFRNNHFSVIFKLKGKIYALLTDVSFSNCPQTWEMLSRVDGDDVFVNDGFQPI